MFKQGKDKKYAVIGIGRFGMAVATRLYELGAEVMAIDTHAEIIDEIQDLVTFAIVLNATQESLLREHGVDKVDCAIVGIGESFEANVLVTSILKSFAIPEVITRAYTDLQRQILKNVGANQVLTPEEDIGHRLARSLVTSEIVDFLELPEGYVVKQVEAPQRVIGKTLAESQIRNKYNLDVVVLRRRRLDPDTRDLLEESIVIPDGDQRIEEGDFLGIIGKEEDIDRFL